LNFSKIVPIDDDTIFVVGGTKNLDFTKMAAAVEPEHSIYKVDMKAGQITGKFKMSKYRLHPTCALYRGQ
jgi:hypothetical protein